MSLSVHRLRVLLRSLLIVGVAANAVAAGTEQTPMPMDAHAHHHMMMDNNQVTRSVVSYSVPQLAMVRQDGTNVTLDGELNDGRPVVMNFIYTTCTTICPLTSQTFRSLQEQLGPQRDKVHLVSISIDPEQDTPPRLTDYAARFHAGGAWQFYTGTLAASVQAQRAFGVYRGDKMNHTPVTLLRAAPGKPWVRLDGFASAEDLLAEVHQFEVAN